MSKILIKNIKSLLQIREANIPFVEGLKMDELPAIDNAFLAIEDGRILAFGSMEEWGGLNDWRNLEIIDADGKYVMPAFCDSHTHIVFAKTRESEFEDRIKGLTYEEIAKKGGGILNSAKKLQETSEDELFASAMKRLDEVARMGTGSIEIKSGYGLTVDAELKMLRVIKRLKEASPLTIKATFLGAHAFPLEFKENHQGYIDQIINEMLPVIAEEGLADYIDAFCERNYFSKEELDQILEAGAKYGLTPKVHVNQFSVQGGIEVSIKHGARSVDHLEEIDQNDIDILKASKCMPTILPSCSFFLNIPYGDARRIMNENIPVALATDYNPGSTPSGNIPFVMSLACIKMKMTPKEVLNATTMNSAYAMNLEETHGSVTEGKIANLIITKEIPSVAHMPYSFGANPVESLILNGKIIF